MGEGNVAPFARSAIDFEVVTVKHNVAIDVVHGGPVGLLRCVACAATGWHISVLNVFDFASKSELSVFGVGKRQLLQVALDLDSNTLHFTFQHRITHIVTHALWQREGQVAMNACSIASRNGALQVQNAQTVGNGAGLPFALPLSGDIRIGHSQLPIGNGHLILLLDPFHGGLHRVQLDSWLFKDAVNADGTVVNGGLDLSAVSIHVKADVGVFNAWPALCFSANFATFKIKVVKSTVGHGDMDGFV